MNKEVTTTEIQELQSYSPQGLISQALAQNLPVETLEKLMDLADRWNAQQAKKEFNIAMSNFQSQCPVIRRRKDGSKTKNGIVAFKYAPIEHILVEKNKAGKSVQDLIHENGFSYIIKTPSFTENSVTCDVEVRHIAGHTETSSVTMPFVTKTEIMSAPQVVAGTITLCKRYAFCDSFGIITGNVDLDELKIKPDSERETIPEPKEKVDWSKLIKNAESEKELSAVWSRMSESEKKEHKSTFTKIKTNIQTARKKESN